MGRGAVGLPQAEGSARGTLVAGLLSPQDSRAGDFRTKDREEDNHPHFSPWSHLLFPFGLVFFQCFSSVYI